MYIITIFTLQAAFARDKRISNPQSTGVVLCGQKQMAEVSNSYCKIMLIQVITLMSGLLNSLKLYSFYWINL